MSGRPGSSEGGRDEKLSTADGLLGAVEYDYRLVILDPETPGILYSLLPIVLAHGVLITRGRAPSLGHGRDYGDTECVFRSVGNANNHLKRERVNP